MKLQFCGALEHVDELRSGPPSKFTYRIFGAGQAGVTTADLAALYPKVTDRELKGQLIWVMSEKRDPAAFDRLMQIAKSDPDREMRKKAIFWLGQSNDPRVKDFLLEKGQAFITSAVADAIKGKKPEDPPMPIDELMTSTAQGAITGEK